MGDTNTLQLTARIPDARIPASLAAELWLARDVASDLDHELHRRDLSLAVLLTVAATLIIVYDVLLLCGVLVVS